MIYSMLAMYSSSFTSGLGGRYEMRHLGRYEVGSLRRQVAPRVFWKAKASTARAASLYIATRQFGSKSV